MMQARYFDGFDDVDSSHETTYYNSGNFSIISPGRFGVGSYANISSSIFKTLEGGPWTYMAAGGAFRWPSVISGTVTMFEFGNNLQHVRMQRNSSGNVAVAGASGVQTIYTGFTGLADVWYHFGFAAKWSGTTGQIRAWLNGSLIATLSLDNIDTDNNASALPKFQYALIGGGQDVDDFYVCAEDAISGSLSDEFLGDLIVRPHYAQLDGDFADWAPSAGTSRYQMIDEIGPDDDTTYLGDSTPGNRVTCGFGTLSPDIASIVSVQPSTVARFEATGPHSIKNSVRRVGISNHDQAAHSLTVNYVGYHDAMALDPVTGLSWTKVGFEARQYGIKDEA